MKLYAFLMIVWFGIATPLPAVNVAVGPNLEISKTTETANTHRGHCKRRLGRVWATEGRAGLSPALRGGRGASLKQGQFYKLSSGRAVYQKP